MGKWWFNGGHIMGFYGILWDFIGFYEIYPAVLKHGWLEKPPFVDDLPLQTSIYMEFPIAMITEG